MSAATETPLDPWLRCLEPDHGRLARTSAGDLQCESCETRYPTAAGRPVFANVAKAVPSTMGSAAKSFGRPGNDRQFILLQMLRSATEASIADWQGVVLDVGCGHKQYRQAAPQVSRWYGTDIWPGPEVDVVAAADRLPFASETFDHVFCSQVLEHVEEPARAVQEMYRVTAPGGTLFLSTPQSWPLHEEPRDFYRFTAHGLAYLAETAGYIEISVAPCGGSLVTLVQLGVMAVSPSSLLSTRWQRRLTSLTQRLESRLSIGSGNTLNNVLTAVKR
jgi:hypothetical protein